RAVLVSLVRGQHDERLDGDRERVEKDIRIPDHGLHLTRMDLDVRTSVTRVSLDRAPSTTVPPALAARANADKTPLGGVSSRHLMLIDLESQLRDVHRRRASGQCTRQRACGTSWSGPTCCDRTSKHCYSGPRTLPRRRLAFSWPRRTAAVLQLFVQPRGAHTAPRSHQLGHVCVPWA